MNTAHLKSKILDLAVRGKLTEQRPEEGSTEELLARIREEKQRLIAEGKLKKEKPLPDITEDEIPFNIPVGWKWVRLGEICEVIMGQSPDGSSITTSSDGIEFHQGKICFTNKFLTQSSIKTFEATRIAVSGSVLLCVRAPVGVVNITLRDICIGRGLCSIYPHYTIEPEFWFYWLKSQKEYFEMKATGTTFKAITINVVRQHCIPLPPLAEQKRIVEKIEAIFKQADIIEENRLALKTAVRHTKSSVLDLAVRGKLTEQNEHDRSVDLSVIKQKKMDLYFEIPDNWSFAHLESITKKISSKPYQILESQVLSSGKFPVISQAKEYSIGFSNDEKKVLFHDHPLVIFGDHTTEVKFVKTNFIVGADGVKIFEPTRSIISAEFLFYVLQFYSINLNKNSGYTRHYKYIKNKGIPLPPPVEQKRIVEKIEQIFGVLDIIENAVEG